VGRAILFDLFNTLLPGGDGDRVVTNHAIAADLGLDAEKFQALMVETWRERMTGGLGDLRAQLAELARRLGGDPSGAQVASAADRRLAFAREHMGVSARADGFSARPRGVYGRAGRPCPRCGTLIRRRGQGDANRTTFWCPGCQR